MAGHARVQGVCATLYSAGGLGLQRRFFDYALKGIGDFKETEPKVEIALRDVNDEIVERDARFRHREAVFSDIKRTLFTKLKITSWPRTHLDSSRAEAAMRLGHIIG